MKPMLLEKLKQTAGRLKREVYALYLACKDPRVPWYARMLAAVVVGYAFSPVDLIPDPVPILGYLDDLILIPLGIALVLKMIPAEVMQDCRQKVLDRDKGPRPKNWIAGTIVIVIWVVLFGLTFFYLYRLLEG